MINILHSVADVEILDDDEEGDISEEKIGTKEDKVDESGTKSSSNTKDSSKSKEEEG